MTGKPQSESQKEFEQWADTHTTNPLLGRPLTETQRILASSAWQAGYAEALERAAEISDGHNLDYHLTGGQVASRISEAVRALAGEKASFDAMVHHYQRVEKERDKAETRIRELEAALRTCDAAIFGTVEAGSPTLNEAKKAARAALEAAQKAPVKD
jgi:hypothetical protein